MYCGKGGDTMSLDAIKQVTDSEAQAREIRAQAQTQAQELLAEARKTAQAAQLQARKTAQAQVRELLVQAEARAGKAREETLSNFDAECGQLQAKAEKKMDEAAALIVRRVVEN